MKRVIFGSLGAANRYLSLIVFRCLPFFRLFHSIFLKIVISRGFRVLINNISEHVVRVTETNCDVCGDFYYFFASVNKMPVFVISRENVSSNFSAIVLEYAGERSGKERGSEWSPVIKIESSAFSRLLSRQRCVEFGEVKYPLQLNTPCPVLSHWIVEEINSRASVEKSRSPGPITIS